MSCTPHHRLLSAMSIGRSVLCTCAKQFQAGGSWQRSPSRELVRTGNLRKGAFHLPRTWALPAVPIQPSSACSPHPTSHERLPPRMQHPGAHDIFSDVQRASGQPLNPPSLRRVVRPRDSPATICQVL
eukprot:4329350-Amphidinium_carterae.1